MPLAGCTQWPALDSSIRPVATVRAFNIRNEVVDAQSLVDDEMLRALEDMTSTARAGKLSSVAALSQAAVAR